MKNYNVKIIDNIFFEGELFSLNGGGNDKMKKGTMCFITSAW